MRYLSHKRDRFSSVIDNYSPIYPFSSRREQLVYSAGVLNFIWNQWNNLWRDYWIAHVSGGYNFNDSPITPILNNYNDKQSCHYLLFLAGKTRRHRAGDAVLGTHQEATWGDPIIITRVATSLISHHPHMTYLLGLLGHYQTYLEHFQKIRNSFIHLNNENIKKLELITSYYSFSVGQELIDILEATDIASSVRCFDNLLDNMEGFLTHL